MHRSREVEEEVEAPTEVEVVASPGPTSGVVVRGSVRRHLMLLYLNSNLLCGEGSYGIKTTDLCDVTWCFPFARVNTSCVKIASL